MSTLDDIAEEFPVLKRHFSGRPLAYLDNAATVQKPRVVLEAIDDFYQKHYANVHRASYDLSHEASRTYEEARVTVAQFLRADPKEIIFVRGATEAINTVALSWGRLHIGQGDVIVLSEMEHHANIVPWALLAEEKGARLRWVGLDAQGEIDQADYRKALQEKPKLVTLTHVSNVLGTVNPVREMTRAAHDVGSLVLIDGAQAAARIRVSVKDIGADFYVFSAHKLYGPTGIGVLYGRAEVLEEMPPAQGGGAMISSVSKDNISFQGPPARFEAGTPPIAEAVGLAQAVRWTEGVGLENISAHERSLTRMLLDELSSRENIFLPGPYEREGIVSFAIHGIHAHDTAEILNRFALALRAGHHCAQPLIESLGVTALTRASFAAYNNEEEVERLLVGIGEVEKIFAG